MVAKGARVWMDIPPLLAGEEPSHLYIKLHALGQRQFCRIIHRLGLAAHIGLPRIRAALAPAAGFFLAAKGAADFRARRANIHIGNAAIRARRRKKTLCLKNITGEDAR